MTDNIFVMIAALSAAIIVASVLYGYIKALQPVTIFEYQKGLLYKRGKFSGLLSAGRYWKLSPGTKIIIEDMRRRALTVQGQEMLTSDNMIIKTSAVMSYQVTDPQRVQEKFTDHQGELYSQIQLALRHVMASKTLEEILANADSLSDEVLAHATKNIDEHGVEIIEINVRDLMLGADTKRAYADLFKAKKEGEAALERARGETAALRSLANGARTLKNNPALFNLRLLQLISDPTAKGATVVLNTSGEPMGGSGE